MESTVADGREREGKGRRLEVHGSSRRRFGTESESASEERRHGRGENGGKWGEWRRRRPRSCFPSSFPAHDSLCSSPRRRQPSFFHVICSVVCKKKSSSPGDSISTFLWVVGNWLADARRSRGRRPCFDPTLRVTACGGRTVVDAGTDGADLVFLFLFLDGDGDRNLFHRKPQPLTAQIVFISFFFAPTVRTHLSHYCVPSLSLPKKRLLKTNDAIKCRIMDQGRKQVPTSAHERGWKNMVPWHSCVRRGEERQSARRGGEAEGISQGPARNFSMILIERVR